MSTVKAETTETERAQGLADRIEAEWAKVCSPHTPNVSVPLTRDDLQALRHLISEARRAASLKGEHIKLRRALWEVWDDTIPDPTGYAPINPALNSTEGIEALLAKIPDLSAPDTEGGGR